MTMTATPLRKGLEAWRNNGAGIIVVKKLDHRGELSKSELVRAGQVVHLSEDERRMNEELAAYEAGNPFRSGALTPVRILDSAEDAKEIADNPNLMSEDDMRVLVKGHPKTFDKKIGEIANAGTLQRLLAVAREEDATVKRVEAIERRLESVAPKAFQEVVTTAPPTPVGAPPRAVTPQ